MSRSSKRLSDLFWEAQIGILILSWFSSTIHVTPSLAHQQKSKEWFVSQVLSLEPKLINLWQARFLQEFLLCKILPEISNKLDGELWNRFFLSFQSFCTPNSGTAILPKVSPECLTEWFSMVDFLPFDGIEPPFLNLPPWIGPRLDWLATIRFRPASWNHFLPR